MFEAVLAALISVAASNHCPEPSDYPSGNYSNAAYIVVDDCAIPDFSPTQHADPRMTEIVVGWVGAWDGRPVLVPVISATARDDAGSDQVLELEVSGDRF